MQGQNKTFKSACSRLTVRQSSITGVEKNGGGGGAFFHHFAEAHIKPCPLSLYKGGIDYLFENSTWQQKSLDFDHLFEIAGYGSGKATIFTMLLKFEIGKSENKVCEEIDYRRTQWYLPVYSRWQ